MSLTVARRRPAWPGRQTTRTDADGLAGARRAGPGGGGPAPGRPRVPGLRARRPRCAEVDHWDDATAGRHARPAGRGGGRRSSRRGEGFEAAGYCSTEAATHVLVSTTGQRAASRADDGPGRRHPPRLGSAGEGGDHRRRLRPGDVRAASATSTAPPAAPVPRPRPGRAANPVELAPGSYEVVLEPRAVAAGAAVPGLRWASTARRTPRARRSCTSASASGTTRVDIWDDATDPRVRSASPFDAEGTPKRRLDLVRAGVTVGLAHDRRSAAPRRRRADGPLGRLGVVRRLPRRPVPRAAATERAERARRPASSGACW